MKNPRQTGLDFEVDKLSNSIENVVTHDSFPSEITLITRTDLTTVTKKNGWQFDWKPEFKEPSRDVYMHLAESAPFNKGKKKFTQEFQAT